MRQESGLRQLARTALVASWAVGAGLATHGCPAADGLATALSEQQSGEVLVFAHEGAGFLAPGNTLAAVEVAVRVGVDGIEVDVRRTSDGELVCFHDETVDATTNGTGAVSDLTGEELRSLEVRWHPLPIVLRSAFPVAPDAALFRDLRTPTLEEMLKAADGRLLVALDTKGPYSAATAAVVRDLGMLDSAVFRVASQDQADAVLAEAPGALLMARPMDEPSVNEMLEALKPAIVHVDHDTLTAPIVARIHAAGSKVWVNAGLLTDLQAILAARAHKRRKAMSDVTRLATHALVPGAESYLRLRDSGADIIQTDNIAQLADLAREWQSPGEG